jgi:AcrR family transcriptional regulator
LAQGAERDRILEAALNVFITQGYRNATLIDVARQAGCSPARVYIHFADLDAIFLELAHDQGEILRESVRSSLAEAPGSEPRPETIIKAFSEYVEASNGASRLLFEPETGDQALEKIHGIVFASTQEIGRAIARGRVGVSQSQALMLAVGLSGMARDVVEFRLRHPLGIEHPDLVEVLVAHPYTDPSGTAGEGDLGLATRLDRVARRLRFETVEQLMNWFEWVANQLPTVDSNGAQHQPGVDRPEGLAPRPPGAVASLQAAIEFSQMVASSYTVPALARELDVTEDEVGRLVGQRALYAIQDGPTVRIPRFQVLAGRLVPELGRIVPLLPDEIHPLEVQSLMTSPSYALLVDYTPVSPVAWLSGGREPRTVMHMIDDYGWLP